VSLFAATGGDRHGFDDSTSGSRAALLLKAWSALTNSGWAPCRWVPASPLACLEAGWKQVCAEEPHQSVWNRLCQFMPKLSAETSRAGNDGFMIVFAISLHWMMLRPAIFLSASATPLLFLRGGAVAGPPISPAIPM